jgi:hypothetical protein
MNTVPLQQPLQLARNSLNRRCSGQQVPGTPDRRAGVPAVSVGVLTYDGACLEGSDNAEVLEGLVGEGLQSTYTLDHLLREDEADATGTAAAIKQPCRQVQLLPGSVHASRFPLLALLLYLLHVRLAASLLQWQLPGASLG